MEQQNKPVKTISTAIEPSLDFCVPSAVNLNMVTIGRTSSTKMTRIMINEDSAAILEGE